MTHLRASLLLLLVMLAVSLAAVAGARYGPGTVSAQVRARLPENVTEFDTPGGAHCVLAHGRPGSSMNSGFCVRRLMLMRSLRAIQNA